MELPRVSASANRKPRKIRYSVAEWTVIVERASACRQPPARYVRMISLGAQPKPIRAQANAAVVHELGRVGNALVALRNQERAARSDGCADTIDAVLSELLTVLKRLG